MTFRIGSMFSGYRGLDLGVESVLDARTVWVCDNDKGPSKVLAHHLPDVPNYRDVTSVDWNAVEPVEILTGGFPCQDVSLAGLRQGMVPDTRSGLWQHMAYAIDKLRPRLVLAENVRGLLSASADGSLEPCPWCVGDDGGVPLRALGGVLGDLAELGYDARWVGLPASSVGAPHERFRVFVAAWPANPDNAGRVEQWRTLTDAAKHPAAQRDRRSFPAHPEDDGQPRSGGARDGRARPPDRDSTSANPGGVGRIGRQDLLRPRRDEALRSQEVGNPGDGSVAWGDYELAIRRWESLTRPVPRPTEPATRGGDRLSPAFVEWMMGLPAGHVTAVPGLTRKEQLKLLGNGVVPQQAAAALRHLLTS